MFPSDAQIQSLVTEVQNIIGQVREQGMQVKEFNEKIRNIERNDTNERFGLELAGALSRIETVSIKPSELSELYFQWFLVSWRKVELKQISLRLEFWLLMLSQPG